MARALPHLGSVATPQGFVVILSLLVAGESGPPAQKMAKVNNVLLSC